MDLWTSPTDRREPCGPCGQPVDNADALPTACPHSRASRPQAPQDQPPVILRGQHRTTLRRGCLHRPFRTTSASHSNRSQHRPRPGSPPILQAHFRMGLDSVAPAHRLASPPNPLARDWRLHRREHRSGHFLGRRVQLDPARHRTTPRLRGALRLGLAHDSSRFSVPSLPRYPWFPAARSVAGMGDIGGFASRIPTR